MRRIIKFEEKSLRIDPSDIDPSAIEDPGSMVDLKDMIVMGKIDPNKFYEINSELFKVTPSGHIIPVFNVTASYNYFSNKYTLSYKEHEIPPSSIRATPTLINSVTQRPYVFYHGTNREFESFLDEFAGTKFGSMNRFYAHYFTTKKEDAEMYGKNLKRAVLQVGKILTPKTWEHQLQLWSEDNSVSKDDFQSFQEWLIAKGYDSFGVPYKSGTGWDEVAVFEAKNIILF